MEVTQEPCAFEKSRRKAPWDSAVQSDSAEIVSRSTTDSNAVRIRSCAPVSFSSKADGKGRRSRARPWYLRVAFRVDSKPPIHPGHRTQLDQHLAFPLCTESLVVIESRGDRVGKRARGTFRPQVASKRSAPRPGRAERTSAGAQVSTCGARLGSSRASEKDAAAALGSGSPTVRSASIHGSPRRRLSAKSAARSFI